MARDQRLAPTVGRRAGRQRQPGAGSEALSRITPSGWKNALLALVATCVVLGSAEILARWLWVAPWHERLLGEQRESQQIGYRENELGLRDRNYPKPKPDGRHRVLLLGDSFTFGLGVADDDEIFAERIERELGAIPGGLDVLNGGIPASLTANWVSLWQRVAPEFEPDLVVAVFFLRDGTGSASIPFFFDRIRGQVSQRDRESPLYRHLFLFRMIRDRMSRAEVAREYTRSFVNSYFGSEQETAEWTRAQSNLLWIRDDAAKRSVPLALVVFPVLVELNGDHPFRAIADEVERFALGNGIPVHNLLPDFLGHSGPDLWVSPMDQHPNARAHAIAADALAPFVRALLLSR